MKSRLSLLALVAALVLTAAACSGKGPGHAGGPPGGGGGGGGGGGAPSGKTAAIIAELKNDGYDTAKAACVAGKLDDLSMSELEKMARSLQDSDYDLPDRLQNRGEKAVSECSSEGGDSASGGSSSGGSSNRSTAKPKRHEGPSAGGGSSSGGSSSGGSSSGGSSAGAIKVPSSASDLEEAFIDSPRNFSSSQAACMADELYDELSHPDLLALVEFLSGATDSGPHSEVQAYNQARADCE